MGDFMSILKISVLILLSVSTFVILILSFKTKKALKFLLLNAILGLAILFGLLLTKKFFGVSLPINEYTVIGSGIFGIPAVVGFILLNLIM